MKINRSALVAVAMIVGSFTAMGCKSSNEAKAEPVAQEQAAAETPRAEAPVVDDTATQTAVTSPGVAQDAKGFRYARPAPPALRFEVEGRAPSAHHVFQRGYWRWDAPRTVYVWSPGFWLDQLLSAPFAPPAVRYEDPGPAPSAEYFYVPGSWRWSGREYSWMGGRWENRREGYEYVQPRCEQRNGRWENRAGYWNARPRADRDDRADRRGDRDDSRRDNRDDSRRDNRGASRDPGFHRAVPIHNVPVKRGHG
jgi:hypothetical protein